MLRTSRITDRALCNRGRPRCDCSTYRGYPAIVIGLFFLSMSLGGNALLHAQNEQPPLVGQQRRQFVLEQLRNLNNDDYRARELARWRIEQHPALAVEIARESLAQGTDFNTSAQLVNMLSVLATNPQIAISLAANETLGQVANQATALGRMAETALRAIADQQERNAFEVLRHHGAVIGPRNFLLDSEMVSELGDPFISLRLDEQFWGDEETLKLIRYLKSVEIVYLKGDRIDEKFYRSVVEMPSLRKLKIRDAKLTNEDLCLFNVFSDLELLELTYINVGDEVIDTIAALPISQSVRLYGTQVTGEGAARLQARLEGLKVFYASGGHLGVSSRNSSTIVKDVALESAARAAGVQENDRITHIHGVPVNTFDELRLQLAKYPAGQEIVISVERIFNRKLVELELSVTLGQERD